MTGATGSAKQHGVLSNGHVNSNRLTFPEFARLSFRKDLRGDRPDTNTNYRQRFNFHRAIKTPLNSYCVGKQLLL